jgi:hypothetical protein
MGRFALELFEGKALMERVRFDFPLLGAGEGLDVPDAGTRRPLHADPPSLVPKLVTRIGVMFPATTRGTMLQVWDRATDRRWTLPWPPQELDATARPDAGPEGG